MSTNDVYSELEVILANQKTILQNQTLILKSQEEILAGQRHCMYRDAVEGYLRSGEIKSTTEEQTATRH